MPAPRIIVLVAISGFLALLLWLGANHYDRVATPDSPNIEPPYSAEATPSIKGRIKAARLPSEGRIRYVPREDYNPANQLPRGPSNGYLDKFGNEWVKGPSRTAGEDFEWDVQLSPAGKSQLGWLSPDDTMSHINVSLKGEITH
jgi:filamentous hemagglutinin